jgi:predicted phosphodiesterase
MAGPPTLSEYDPAKYAEVVRRIRAGDPKAKIAGELGVNKSTVFKIATNLGASSYSEPAPHPTPHSARIPEPAAEAGGVSIPDAEHLDYSPTVIDSPGTWGVLSDVHIPYHDKRTVEKSIAEAKSRNAAGFLLNGDVLDFYQLSDYDKNPSKPRVKQEIEKGRQLLEYIRAELPRARIIYKLGNHDERLIRYLGKKASEIFDLDELSFKSLLHAEKHGVEIVGDKRVVMLGKLPVIHGHEYRGGGGVMPARWLFIRAWSNAMLGHFHQPSYFPVRTLDQRELAVWSTGCACFMHPEYAPLNQWAHGWATVELFQGGTFHVHNRRLLKDGQVT